MLQIMKIETQISNISNYHTDYGKRDGHYGWQLNSWLALFIDKVIYISITHIYKS